MQLDDNLKGLLRELGRAINEAVSDSDRIARAIAEVRTAGYDIVLKLDPRPHEDIKAEYEETMN